MGNNEDRFNEKHKCAKFHIKNLDRVEGRERWMDVIKTNVEAWTFQYTNKLYKILWGQMNIWWAIQPQK